MTSKRIAWIVMAALLSLGAGRALAYEGYEDVPADQEHYRHFYLGFSVADGPDWAYETCTGCDTYVWAPFEFELLAGYRLTRFFALDLGVTWSLNYWDPNGNHNVSSVVGLRPGVRVIFPLLFHRSIYLRAAVPIYYDMAPHSTSILVAFLFGVGAEWRFGMVGIFGELDIAPYFIETYDGYRVIPTEGRLGLNLHF